MPSRIELTRSTARLLDLEVEKEASLWCSDHPGVLGEEAPCSVSRLEDLRNTGLELHAV